MAVNFVMQSSLIQPKPSLSLKTLQNPSLPQLSRLASPSRVGFLLTKRSGVVGKLSASSAVPDSAFSVLETKQDSQNPIILIDNYDSFFTYNLCQIWYLGELGCSLKVCRNDELTVEELKRKNPRGVVISPGPGVSTGMWCICEAFRGKTVRSPYGLKLGDSCCVYYVLGYMVTIEHVAMLTWETKTNLSHRKLHLASLTTTPSPHVRILSAILPFQAGRCPGAFLDMDGFPLKALKVTAFTEDGLIMAARHKIYKYLHGVHFSQESIITSEGKIIVQNFIKLIERKKPAESQN
ncbi:hypothetical protein PVK06_046904 [Gossypium arboreum]|uniref:anthranilate synthase n=1 Tax=Gossypium arboreum TaxID=29729 RepID=A0ABR0MBZ7_GOSAR|nr:hypothetical protein PVK06_046904 [Gossypium arboreum]